MLVTSHNKKLAQYASNYAEALKALGKKRADMLHKRMKAFANADTLEDLKMVAGHFHELVDNRKGQWACDLDQPYRLIFEPHEKPIPTNENGKYIWIEIKEVELIEIINYHGK